MHVRIQQPSAAANAVAAVADLWGQRSSLARQAPPPSRHSTRRRPSSCTACGRPGSRSDATAIGYLRAEAVLSSKAPVKRNPTYNQGLIHIRSKLARDRRAVRPPDTSHPQIQDCC